MTVIARRAPRRRRKVSKVTRCLSGRFVCRAGAHRAPAPRRLDVGGRLSTRPTLTQTPALASPCEIEREPCAEGSSHAAERDRDPARGAGGRGRRRADKAGCSARRQRQTTADAANRFLDRSGAKKVHLQLLARSRTRRTLDRLDKSEDA